MMKNTMPFIAIMTLVVLGLFSNCKKDDDQPVPECMCQSDSNYILFGKYYGMCYGACVDIFKIENSMLFEDTTDHYPSGNAPYNGVYVALPSAKYNLVKDIAKYVPAQLLNQTDTIIGIPDAYDQGGYYLELKQSGNTRFWLIDTDTSNTPGYLHAFTDTLNYYIERIQ